jgi:hypothetical protein
MIARLMQRIAGRVRRDIQKYCARVAALPYGRQCAACGKRVIFIGRANFDPRLIREWGLDARWRELMALREGCCCSECGASLRSEHLARVLIQHLCNDLAPASSLKTLVCKEPFQSLQIAEINTAGQLHKYLAAIPGLTLSSYGSTDPAIPSEDLTNLSYANESYDLVVTSETLEHVPDYRRALGEIYRILRPGGAHIFTVPIVIDQSQTRRRARIANGELELLLPPTYHGDSEKRWSDFLVFYEFGVDFVAELQEAGFTTELVVSESNPAVTAFICVKPRCRAPSQAI